MRPTPLRLEPVGGKVPLLVPPAPTPPDGQPGHWLAPPALTSLPCVVVGCCSLVGETSEVVVELDGPTVVVDVVLVVVLVDVVVVPYCAAAGAAKMARSSVAPISILRIMCLSSSREPEHPPMRTPTRRLARA